MGETRRMDAMTTTTTEPTDLGDDAMVMSLLQEHVPLALHDLELDALVLVQAAVAVRLDRREVHEDVGAAAVLRDEAEALLSVEPLHSSLCHLFLLRGKRVRVPHCAAPGSSDHGSLGPVPTLSGPGTRNARAQWDSAGVETFEALQLPTGDNART